MMKRLSDEEVCTLSGALRSAISTYSGFATNDELPDRLRDQFQKQKEEAQALLALIDESDTIELTAWGDR